MTKTAKGRLSLFLNTDTWYELRQQEMTRITTALIGPHTARMGSANDSLMSGVSFSLHQELKERDNYAR